jgi:hypothetical protein
MSDKPKEIPPDEAEAIEAVRRVGRKYGCRIEINSWDTTYPVCASTLQADCHAFGLSGQEAVVALEKRRRAKEAKEKARVAGE